MYPLRLVSTLALLVLCPALRAEPLQHEFLLFSSAQSAGTFDRTAPFTNIDHDEVLTADMLFTLQQGPLKLFGEYQLTDHESDLERFQLGWQLSNDTIVWVGRYHQPSSVYNHEHHHGQYLQTSISRPAIEEWEDQGGVLPQHFTGVLVESSAPAWGGYRVRVAAAGGLTPLLTPNGMQPLDVLHPSGGRRPGFQLRLSVHPSEFSESACGVLLAHDELAALGWPAQGTLRFDHADLSLYGVFGTYVAGRWRLNATLYYARAALDTAQPGSDEKFVVGYVQGERALGHALTGFLRWEDAGRTGDALYLRLYKGFARDRYIGGLRWDFLERQALTVQVTQSHTFQGHFKDVRVQWSGAFF